MLQMLIRIGRTLVAVSAITVIVAGGIIGWAMGMAMDAQSYGFMDQYAVTPWRLFGLTVGVACGILVAGNVFGLVAAVYDMQRCLRLMAPKNAESDYTFDHDIPRGPRREPVLTS